MSWDLVIARNDLTSHEVRQTALAPLRPGEVRLAVERFGITTVTATYALFGDSPMQFFGVFPGPDGFGRVPVWGFATVAESRSPDVAEGSRYFGYLPMSTHHTVTPEIVPGGFVDSAQQAVPHDWYRTYEIAAPDELDDRRALLHPLFPCSFTLAGYVGQQVAAGVKSVLISSASCKTAIGLADLLSKQDGVSTTGITSGAHKAFVKDLGFYDHVVAYDELGTDAVTDSAFFVDFTNSADRMRAVYQHAGARLTGTVLAGFTHPSESFAPPQLDGPEPQLYFTPAVEQQIMAEVGTDEYRARYRAAEQEFLAGTKSWLVVRNGSGPDAIAESFRTVLAGELSPSVGAVLRP
ncbi:DUF2855 family protein [Kibdelosporangium phytohabitans]|uniref:DUF2855 domain-containing protein n=1 Tax=Kibdelosporangium phytohabitans TaxID=860235 RepID=A0A0N9I765_9PSEU|nr:DUF2855 family protein [Kibdelosporangium phytohabitans]ALG10750.1 hypothetical protein AOZ06_31115 [Kibdelosporangium phytohabitans]MBE1461900.1 hypothetical protein [Kibdelosporangium phytohabitans]